jgi:hypothetical protein
MISAMRKGLGRKNALSHRIATGRTSVNDAGHVHLVLLAGRMCEQESGAKRYNGANFDVKCRNTGASSMKR